MAHPDYEEFVAALNGRAVRYLIAGAHAVAFHARPRASKDLDIIIGPSEANAKRTVAAIADFFGDEPPRYASVTNLIDPEVVVQLGVAPVRIDLLSQLASTTFRKAYNRGVAAHFGSVDARYLSLEDLIAEKQIWDRLQDRADVAVLRRVLDKRRSTDLF